jgi:tetratricopeptide (TPR) repeat protein
MRSFLANHVRLSLILLALTFALKSGAHGSDEDSDASSIVQEALQAEVDGDTAQRRALLDRALQLDPNHSAARWHSGYVRLDGAWLTVDEAEQSPSVKVIVAAYQTLRNAHSGSLAGELAMARWCRKKGLEHQERLHWANSLNFDRNNREARRRLGVREFRGQLLTAEQIEDWKLAMRDYEQALESWNPRLNRWRREIESSPSPDQTEAWRQLASVDVAEAVPSLAHAFRKANIELQLHMVSVLGNIEGQAATDVLARLSIDSPRSEIRQAAATQLGNRSWFGFVPNLLGRLETPVECRYVVNTLGSGVLTEVRYSKETPSAVVNVSHSVNSQFPISPNRHPSSGNLIVFPFAMQEKLIANEAARQYRRIRESMQAVEANNAQTNRLNERVFAALRTSTDQQIEPRPEYWWDWWQEYNERHLVEDKPEIEYRDSRYSQRMIPNVSCFAAGTLVWTESGPVAIEDVRQGDRVLSQNPDSGELAYRIVLQTTVRPPSPTLQIQVADERIEATLGHPVWVTGRGWRMAKELTVGDRLHGVQGGMTIDSIEPGPTSEAYNLIVAETSTYFIGKRRLLVHDNMPRRAIDIPVPGWER